MQSDKTLEHKLQVTATDLRRRWFQLIARAEQGEVIIVTRRGKPWFELAPIKSKG